MYGSIRRLSRALAAVCFVALSGAAYAQTPAPAQDKSAAASLPSARSIIDRHVEAIGGRKAIAGHKSYRMRGMVSIPAQGVTGKLEAFSARPNKSRLKITIDGIGDIEEAFDGTHGWSLSPMTGPMLMKGDELQDRKADAEFDAELRDDAQYEYLKTVEKTTFEGRPVYKIAIKRKGSTREDIEYYDVETGLKAGMEATRTTQMGPLQVVAVQTDYKKFDDMMYPTTIKQKMMGVEQIMTFTSVEHDMVEPTAFDMPAAVKALIK